MSHGIEIWRAVLSTPATMLTLLVGLEEELPEAGDEAVIELSRQYPGLSRELAEYLAR